MDRWLASGIVAAAIVCMLRWGGSHGAWHEWWSRMCTKILPGYSFNGRFPLSKLMNIKSFHFITGHLFPGRRRDGRWCCPVMVEHRSTDGRTKAINNILPSSFIDHRHHHRSFLYLIFASSSPDVQLHFLLRPYPEVKLQGWLTF